MKVDFLTVLNQLLAAYNVPLTKIKKPYLVKDFFSDEIRMKLNSNLDWTKIINQFINSLSINTLHIMSDFIGIQYALFFMPNTTDCILIGPYRLTNQDASSIQKLKDLGFDDATVEYIKDYYLRISLVNEDLINMNVASILSTIFSKDHFEIKHIIENRPLNIIPGAISLKKQERNLAQSMELLEKRYKIENDILDAITAGDSTKAMIHMNAMKNREVAKRFLSSLRLQKNSLIIMNSLMRKAIEKANVHPYYIDEISSKFANKIELTADENECYQLQLKMVLEYCDYVHKYSVKNYSPVIKKIINYINLNLSSELSLKDLAEYVNMNASYISNQFRNETGTTIINYINHQRMRQASYLLRNTQRSIAFVAESVGIFDLNYFSRLFKRYMSYTPTQYRKMTINK